MKIESKVKCLLVLVAFCFFGFSFFSLANEHLVGNPLTENTTGVRITDLGAKILGWLWITSVILTMLVEAWWGFQIKEKIGNARFMAGLFLLVCFSVFGIYLNYFFLLKSSDSDLDNRKMPGIR